MRRPFSASASFLLSLVVGGAAQSIPVVEEPEWQYAVGNMDGRFNDNLYDARLFREMVEASDLQIVKRECPTCTNTHKNIYYRRLTPMPDDFDLLDNLMNNWFDEDNKHNLDFALYSSWKDAVEDVNRWKECNFNDDKVGFPRDCGPEKLTGGQWNSYLMGGKGHAFYIPENPAFDSQLTNIARGKPVRQMGTRYDGVPERAIDGNTVGVWQYGTVTHTERLWYPYWEVDLQHESTVNKVYFWNRLDCCGGRLSDVLVEVYDAPNGDVVASELLEGPAKRMNTVDFGGVTGQTVRITITADEKRYLSLAEVEIEGSLDGPPVSNIFPRIDGPNYSEESGTHTVDTGAVGHFNSGDYLTYQDVNFGSAGTTRSILFSYSKGNNSGGTMEVRLGGPNGDLIQTFTPNRTGSWRQFVTTSITLPEVEGLHDLTLVARDAGGVLDVKWLELTDALAFSILTDYRVNDNGGSDVQCTYGVLLEAFQEQIYDQTNDGTLGTVEEEFFALLGVSNEEEARGAVYNMCGEAQRNAKQLSFEQVTSDYGSQFVDVHYTGHGPWNNQYETLLFPSDGDTPAHVLKEDAANVKTYYELSKEAGFKLPDLPQFDPTVCTANAAQCCWPRDRQANDNNGNCATPYDENCVDKDVADNTDLCYNELHLSPYSSHINADGFTVFDEEGPIHCHGFAWANDEQETLSRYKGNALFFVSMYDHMYVRGYVENIPGSPMCGCVEHMPVVSRSDCTQTNVQESYVFTKRPNDTGLVGDLDHIRLQYQSCQGANNNNNDLEAFVQQLVNDEKLTTAEQDIFKTRIIGNNQCRAATESLIESQGFERGYTIDKTKWTFFAGIGFEEAGENNYDSRLFKEMVEALEIPIVRRVCTDCRNSHQDIYYRRLTPMPDDFDLLDVLLNNWFDTNNEHNTDFALYSSYIDAYFDTNRWNECNFNDRGVGFPRDCGPNGLVGGQWNSHYRTNRKHAFMLPANDNFESQLTNIARGRPVRQISTSHGGSPERAVDGSTIGAWNRNSVTHTHTMDDPWWEVDLEHNAVINQVYIWNRIDCCEYRLSDVQVDVYDEPYGSIVAQKTVSGQLKQMNVVDFEGATGQVVRITRKTNGDPVPLSLAEVEIEGELGPSPTASPTRQGSSNVALASKGATAYQSHTSHGGDASRAIDGNTDGNWRGSSVTHTPRMNNPAWSVVLDQYYSISKVEVYNREDCCTERLMGFVVNIYRAGLKVYTSDPKNYDWSHYEINIPYIVGNHVEVMIPGDGKTLSLAEVMVYGVEEEYDGPTNVALASSGATAFQSVTSYGGVPSRAIDGNKDGHWRAGSVTHTRPGMFNPFWEVKLDGYFNITYVEVYNRLDCCSDRIRDFIVTVFAGGYEVYSDQATSDILSSYAFTIPGIVGNKVQIMLPGGSRTLSLAEVVVMGMEAEYNGPVLPDNIALASNGAVASQTGTGHGGVASRGIDGNTDGNWRSSSVTHTPAMTNPSWEVQLDQFYNISRVELYNRFDCCSDRLRDFVLIVYRGGINVYSVTSDTQQNFYSFDTSGVIGDKVQVLLPGNGRILSLAEVQVFGEAAEWDGPVFTNVALSSKGAVAFQSKTDHGGVASRAIDGNTAQNWRSGSLTHTKDGSGLTDPFWEVMLNQKYYVSRIDVYNRVDCCGTRLQGFVLKVYSGDKEVFNVTTGIAQDYYTFEITPSVLADRVQIMLPGKNRILTLAEVQVIASEDKTSDSKAAMAITQISSKTSTIYNGVIYKEPTDEENGDAELFDEEYNGIDLGVYDPDDNENDFDDGFLLEPTDDTLEQNIEMVDDDNGPDVDLQEKEYDLDDTLTDFGAKNKERPKVPTLSPTISTSPTTSIDDDVGNNEPTVSSESYLLDDTTPEDDDDGRDIRDEPVDDMIPPEDDPFVRDDDDDASNDDKGAEADDGGVAPTDDGSTPTIDEPSLRPSNAPSDQDDEVNLNGEDGGCRTGSWRSILGKMLSVASY